MAHPQELQQEAQSISNEMQALSDKMSELVLQATAAPADGAAHLEPFLITGLTVFVLACFVGYHVVWRVTPALHSPLMAITNAISSVIIVGAILAVGPFEGAGFSKFMGFLAVVLASVNIFGGFIITKRMLHMFQKKA